MIMQGIDKQGGEKSGATRTKWPAIERIGGTGALWIGTRGAHPGGLRSLTPIALKEFFARATRR